MKGNQREEESLVSPPQPHSRGILDGPGGEPDGAEQGWGVQGVEGRYWLRAPRSVLCLTKCVCACLLCLFSFITLCVYILFGRVNMCVCLCT